MPSRKFKAPRKDAVTIEVRASAIEDIHTDLYPAWPHEDGRATAASFHLTGPNGEMASVFMQIIYHGGRWYAEISHDATDYNTDRTAYRRQRIPLTFFGE